MNPLHDYLHPNYADDGAIRREQQENELVGKMLRELLEFEGRVADSRTLGAMQAVVDRAVAMASVMGLNAEHVRATARRIQLSTIAPAIPPPVENRTWRPFR